MARCACEHAWHADWLSAPLTCSSPRPQPYCTTARATPSCPAQQSLRAAVLVGPPMPAAGAPPTAPAGAVAGASHQAATSPGFGMAASSGSTRPWMAHRWDCGPFAGAAGSRRDGNCPAVACWGAAQLLAAIEPPRSPSFLAWGCPALAGDHAAGPAGCRVLLPRLQGVGQQFHGRPG